MLIKVTQTGVSTRLTKPEIKKIGQVQQIVRLMAEHQPVIEDYQIAADALERCLEYWRAGAEPDSGDSSESDATIFRGSDNPSGNHDSPGGSAKLSSAG